MNKKISLIITSILAILCFNAFACSCKTNDIFEDIERFDNILLVETTALSVVESESKDKFNLGTRRATFNVIQTFKGNQNNVMYLESADRAPCCLCEQTLEITQYLVFALHNHGVRINACGPSQPVTEYNSYLLEIIPLIVTNAVPEEFSGVVMQKWPSEFTPFDSSYSSKLIGYDGKFRKASAKFKGFSLSDGRIFVTNILKESELSLTYEERDMFD